MTRTKGSATEVHPTGPMMSLTKEERERLKRLRIDRGMKQSELGKRVGVTAATISNLETKTGQVRRSVYAKIMRVLSPKAAAVSEADDLFQRIVDSAVDLDGRGLAVVAAVIDQLKKSDPSK